MSAVFVAGLVLGVLAGVGIPFLLRSGSRLFAPGQPRALPPPAGTPENRAEAVRRVLKHLQRKSIAELEDGSAAVIVGAVKAIDGVAPLRAPYSGTECLGYHLDVRIAEFQLSSFLLPQVKDRAQTVELEVEDATGTVRVSAEGLELAISDGAITRWMPPHPPVVQDMVPREYHHLPVTIEEGLLQPGMTLLVCGVAVRELGVTNYRDGASRLVLRATATFPLVASTDVDLLAPGERPIAPEELRRR